MTQGTDDSVDVHCVRVRDIEHLNAIAFRNLGAEILDTFDVSDMAELSEQGLAEAHEISRVEGNAAIVMSLLYQILLSRG